MISVASLLRPVTKNEVRQTLLDLLAAAGFPVTSWASGRAARSLVEGISQVVSDMTTVISQVAGSGFLGTAAGDWLTLHAASQYDLQREPAAFTIGKIKLTDTASAGPYTIAAGQLRVKSSTGYVYSNIDGGVVPLNGSISTLSWRAESPGAAWNIPINSALSLITDLPGVSPSNPEYLSSGTWITTSGADEESDVSLRQRCLDRWSTLGRGATAPAIRYMCLSASAEVQKVKILDAPGDGTLTAIVAGTSAPVSSAAVIAVQAYLNDETHRATCTQVTVINAAVQVVNLPYAVHVQAAYRASAEQQILAAISALQASLPIGPTVYVSQIVALMQAVVGVVWVQIPPGAADIALTNQIVSFNPQLTFVTT